MAKTIQIASDLRTFLEPSADYLILAGDIGYPSHDNYQDFIRQCSELFEKVFLITGNHEYYSKESIDIINDKVHNVCNLFDNVFFLNNSSFDDPDSSYVFLGTTLWSYVPKSKRSHVQYSINDYRHILNGQDHPINAEETTQMFMNNLKWLEKETTGLEESGKDVVVITHHMPSYEFIDKKYKGFPGNSAFANHLETFPKKHPNVKLWFFGHTHSSCDVVMNGCQFIANPRGYDRYGKPENALHTKNKVI